MCSRTFRISYKNMIQGWAIGREFRLRIKLAFDQARIKIGMPQRMLWHHKELNLANRNTPHHSSS